MPETENQIQKVTVIQSDVKIFETLTRGCFTYCLWLMLTTIIFMGAMKEVKDTTDLYYLITLYFGFSILYFK